MKRRQGSVFSACLRIARAAGRAGLILIIVLIPASLPADVINFASFTTASATPLYTFTNNGDGTGTFTQTVGSSVYFVFTAGSIPDAYLLEPLPTAPIQASLIRTSTTATAAVCSPCTAGSPVQQEVGTGSVEFTFTDSNGEHLLLGISGSDLIINGFLGGSTANFSGSSSSSSISFSSDYINFSAATAEDRSISLNAITPALGIASDGLVNSFTAQASGDFGVQFAPEPASATTLCLAGVAALCVRRRRSRLRNTDAV
jgi:hypothetical protein